MKCADNQQDRVIIATKTVQQTGKAATEKIAIAPSPRSTHRSIVFTMWRPYVPHMYPVLPWAHASQPTNRHRDQFSHFTGLTVVTNTQTERENLFAKY